MELVFRKWNWKGKMFVEGVEPKKIKFCSTLFSCFFFGNSGVVR